jgi:hypothetical protein
MRKGGSGASRTALAALLVAAFGLDARSARGDDPPAPSPAPGAETGATEEPESAAAALDAQIKTAIEKGVAFLKARQMPSGSWGDIGTHVKTYKGGDNVYQHPIGPTALSLYALLKCDVPVTDPVVKKGFEWLKQAGVSAKSSAYEVSAALLAVTAVADPFKKDKDSKAAGARVRLTGDWRNWAMALRTSLMEHRSARGWRYQPKKVQPGGDEDVSSTQFAVLALAAADRCGIATDPAVYGDAAAYVLTLQEPDGPEVERVVRPRARPSKKPPADAGRYGPARPEEPAPKDRARGFHYSVHPTTKDHDKIVSGARTACGVGALALARYALADAKGPPKKSAPDQKALEQAIFDGLAWLSEHWDPWRNHGVGNKNVYYLYCVERAMDLVGAERLGGRSWYLEMVQALLPHQDPKGFWDTKDAQVGDRNPVCDTCFALLFLRRAAKGGVPIPIVTGDDDAPPVDGR